MSVSRVVQTRLRLVSALEDVCDVFDSSVSTSRLRTSDTLAPITHVVGPSVLILLAAFGQSSYAIVVQFDDFGHFVHVDGKATLTSPAAQLVGACIGRMATG